jgi:hypothetical protein
MWFVEERLARKGLLPRDTSNLPCILPNLGDDFDGGGSILFRINLGGKRGRMAQDGPG